MSSFIICCFIYLMLSISSRHFECFFIKSTLSECFDDGKIFQCSSNLDKINFTEVSDLDLSHRGLTELPWDTLKAYQFSTHLNLSSNLLRRIEDRKPFAQLQKLEYLDLSNNSLIGINLKLFTKNRALKVLILSGNPHMLLSMSTVDLPNLKELHLEDCGLDTLHENMFRGLTGLKILNLQWNQLREVPDWLSTVNVIMLKGNPIVMGGVIQNKVVNGYLEYYFGWLLEQREGLLEVQIGLFLFAGAFYVIYYMSVS